MIILDELNVCPALMHFIGSKTLKNGEFQGHKVFHVLSFSIGPNGGFKAQTSKIREFQGPCVNHYLLEETKPRCYSDQLETLFF